MKTELKNTLKLMKYAYQLKANLIITIAMFLLGIVFLLIDDANSLLLGSDFLILSFIMAETLIRNLAYSDMISASPYKPMLHLWFPNMFYSIIGIVTYLITLIFALIKAANHPEAIVLIADKLVFSCIWIVIMNLYNTISFKKFKLGTVLFVLSSIVFFVGIIMDTALFSLSLPQGCIWGFVILLIGNLVCYILRHLLYKKAVSKLAVSILLK